jgi:hypothetical protein
MAVYFYEFNAAFSSASRSHLNPLAISTGIPSRSFSNSARRRSPAVTSNFKSQSLSKYIRVLLPVVLLSSCRDLGQRVVESSVPLWGALYTWFFITIFNSTVINRLRAAVRPERMLRRNSYWQCWKYISRRNEYVIPREKCKVGQHFQHFVESNGDDKRQAVR